MWNGGFTKEKPCAFPQEALRWPVKAFLVALKKNVFQIASAKEFYLRLQHSSEPEKHKIKFKQAPSELGWEQERQGKKFGSYPYPILSQQLPK